MSLQPKYLKLIQAGYENYSGPIGAYEFVDGVSTVMLPRNDRDRLATAFQFVEFTEAGVDEVEAGVASRMLRDAAMIAQDQEPLARMTEEEKAQEDATIVVVNEKPPVIYSREDLEKIADKKGINGLRDIAEPWNVKHRSILPLISLIMTAQDAWLAERQAAFEARGITREAFEASLRPDAVKLVETAPVINEAPAQEDDADYEEPDPVETPSPDETQEAAATGDMSAAITQE